MHTLKQSIKDYVENIPRSGNYNSRPKQSREPQSENELQTSHCTVEHKHAHKGAVT
jgi:hypothetical protein